MGSVRTFAWKGCASAYFSAFTSLDISHDNLTRDSFFDPSSQSEANQGDPTCQQSLEIPVWTLDGIQSVSTARSEQEDTSTAKRGSDRLLGAVGAQRRSRHDFRSHKDDRIVLEHNAAFLPRIFLLKLDVVAPVNTVCDLAGYYRALLRA